MTRMTRLGLPLLGATLLLAPALGAQATATPAKPAASAASTAALPAASEILAKYVAAMGGKDAITKRASITYTGSFEMPAAGMKGDLVLVQDPTRMAMKMTVPGLGEILQGFDGTHGWAMNPMQGSRLLEGKELAQAQETAGYASMLRQAPAVAKAETVERTTLDGRDCWKVKVTSATGRESHECYDVTTGLMVGSWVTVETPMGAITQTSIARDYRDFGGLMLPAETRVSANGQEQVLRFTTVEYGRADAAALLEPPAAVKALKPAAP